MEIELKYLIDDEQKADRIWQELRRHSDAVAASEEEKQMHAVYFDAEDGRLSREGIALRIRREGEEMVATVKWSDESEQPRWSRRANPQRDGSSAGEKPECEANPAGEKPQRGEPALHMRPELSAVVEDESWFTAPPADLFCGTDIGERIRKLMGEEALRPVLDTEFCRRLIRLQSHDGDGSKDSAFGRGAVCEAAVDVGIIRAGGKSEPICELELELLDGDANRLMEWGRQMEAAYGLVAGVKSKFARGKALRDGKTGGEDGATP